MGNMKRSILLCIGWLFSGALLLAAGFMLEADLNMFDWLQTPASSVTIYSCLGIAVALTGIWFFARATRDKVSRVVSIIVSLVIVGFGVYWFPVESVSTPGVKSFQPTPAHSSSFFPDLNFNLDFSGMFARKSASPVWYRGGRLFVACLPAAFCLWWWRRHAAHQSAGGNAAPPRASA